MSKISLSGRVIAGALALAILAFWPMSWLGFVLPKMLILFFGLACALVLFLLEGGKLRFDFWPLFLAAAFFILAAVATFFGPAPWSSFFGVSESLTGFQTYFLFAGMFILGLGMVKREQEFVWQVLRGVGVLVAGYAILQFLSLDPLAGVWRSEDLLGRSFSTIGNPNWLAGVLLLLLPLGLFWERTWGRWFYLGLMVLGILTTGSKAAFLALGLVFLWRLQGRKRWYALAGLAFLAFLVLGLVYGGGGEFALWRSLKVREILWSDSFEMIVARPFGYGLELFRFYYPQFLSPELWQYEALTASIVHAHNYFLELWLGMGPLAVLSFYGLLTWLLLRRDGPLVMGVLAYAFANLFGFETLLGGAIFWLFVGVLCRGKREGDGRLVMGVLALGAFVLMGFSAQHLWANFAYEDGRPDVAAERFAYDRVYLLSTAEILLRNDGDAELIAKYLDQADRISGSLDADALLLRAWLERSPEIFARAKASNPNGFRTYLIGLEIFGRDAELLEEFEAILPDYWRDADTYQGRIFQKNYPWVEEYF